MNNIPALAPRWRRTADEFPRALSWSVSGQELAWGTASGVVAIARTDDGEMLRTLRLPAGLTALSWHPREPRLLAGCEDGAVFIIDAASGETTKLLPATGGWTEHVAWNPKGSKLAVARGRQETRAGSASRLRDRLRRRKT